jgi:hypothetical protein
VIAKMIENFPSDDFKQTELTLERLIQTAEREMNDVIKLIFERVADLVHETLQIKIGNYYRDVKRGKSNVRVEFCFLQINYFPLVVYGGCESIY